MVNSKKQGWKRNIKMKIMKTIKITLSYNCNAGYDLEKQHDKTNMQTIKKNYEQRKN